MFVIRVDSCKCCFIHLFNQITLHNQHVPPYSFSNKNQYRILEHINIRELCVFVKHRYVFNFFTKMKSIISIGSNLFITLLEVQTHTCPNLYE